ncbi:unnamed protein product [Larinioides sclopetarius]|uniref:Uncharacterized protein n=1 Tax=Larinioides sclopetarius TaxID=280406 RepID=A0AAV2BMP5_9ARAC
MNMIIFASLLLSAVSVHANPFLKHQAAAPVYSYRPYGHLLSAHDSYGSGIYGSHDHQRDSGIAAHDSHAVSSHDAHKAYEADDDHFNKYKNVGTYSHDKGEGFEKAYHYEKVNGQHDIISNDNNYKASYGDHGAKSYIESQAHGASGHKVYESHNKYGANRFGSHEHLKSAYGKVGNGQSSHASSVHLPADYPVYHRIGEHNGVHQGYSRYPVGNRAEYVPSYGSNHGYSKVYVKGPGYEYHY